MTRRGLLLAFAAAAEPRTVVYKTIDGLALKAEIWGEAAAGTKPGVLYLHGGALMWGFRKLDRGSLMLSAMLGAGFTVMSVDYRVAPETKLAEIAADVRDAWQWIHRHGGSMRIDTSRLTICGGSAGGFLTLLSGGATSPRPRALLAYEAPCEIDGPWATQPSPAFLKYPLVSREDALASIGSSPVAETTNTRRPFYVYCRQNGLYAREVAGHDPATYSPIRYVTRLHPPTFLLHGTGDTEVPYDHSERMAARFQELGVEHEFVTVPDGVHGLKNISVDEQKRVYATAVSFLARHT